MFPAPSGSSEGEGEKSQRDTAGDLAHVFADLLEKANFYVTKDFDEISGNTIRDDLEYLKGLNLMQRKKELPPKFSRTFQEKTRNLQGLIQQIIPHFYRARGLATLAIPRKFSYYKHMTEARNFWISIKGVIESQL